MSRGFLVRLLLDEALAAERPMPRKTASGEAKTLSQGRRDNFANVMVQDS